MLGDPLRFFSPLSCVNGIQHQYTHCIASGTEMNGTDIVRSAGWLLKVKYPSTGLVCTLHSHYQANGICFLQDHIK